MADDNNNNYSYNASVPAAAVAVSLWALISATHLYQAFKYKTLYLIPLLIFVYLETLGYGTRIGSIKNPDPLWIIVVSETALVTAPAFLAAQYYMVIGRVMSFVGSEFSWIRHSRITKVFVAADVFAILTQATGGSMLASSDDTDGMKRAKYILIIGLVIQVIVFGFFFFLAIFYDVKSSRAWRGKVAPATGSYGTKDVRPLWNAFYVGAVCLTVRSVYRTIEFASINFELGQDDPQGYLITHEWCLYVFDTLLILIAAVSYNICHPGAYLPRTKGPRMDGGYEEIPGRRRFLCCGARKPPKTMSTASSTSNIQMHTV